MVDKWSEYDTRWDQQLRIVNQMRAQMLNLANHTDHDREALREHVMTFSTNIKALETRSENLRVDMAGFKCQLDTLLSRDREGMRRMDALWW